MRELVTFYHLWVAVEWEATFQAYGREVFLNAYSRWDCTPGRKVVA